MTFRPYRADAPAAHPLPRDGEVEPGIDQVSEDHAAGFDPVGWDETRSERDRAGDGGRAVLGWALSLLALAWTAYTFWSAGRALATLPLTSPALAQWVAVFAGPMALLGLVWLMFGRTRRKEAERFTRSVVAMRTEARSLEALLEVVTQRLRDSHNELGSTAQQLMGLGDEATARLGGVARDLAVGSEQLVRSGQALDRAADAARSDLGVILADLPRAEATALAMAQALRDAGRDAAGQAATFEVHVRSLGERAEETDGALTRASRHLADRLTEIDAAAADAGGSLIRAGDTASTTIDAVLNRAAETLEDIRAGVDAQAQAVSALVAQSSAGLGRAGIEAADALGERLQTAGQSLDGLSTRVAEQERVSQRLLAGIDSSLSALDTQFASVAQQGDDRTNAIRGSLERLRGELQLLGEQSMAQDHGLDSLAQRTADLQQAVAGLSGSVGDDLGRLLGEAESSAGRLLATTEAARPHVEWLRDSSAEAGGRLDQSAAAIETQHERLAELMAAVDGGVGMAEARLAELRQAVGQASNEAQALSSETGPALIAALVQVREAGNHAADRAREAIASIIPQSAGQLSDAVRAALEGAVRDTVTRQLAQLDTVATAAIESARSASDRLTGQLVSIGQTATALEAHFEQVGESQRQNDSEHFAKRVSLLIDSMHSASIDVAKILSEDVDDRAWATYLKGDRGVFTRRASRLASNSETRTIATHYEQDGEFHNSVNRYVHDFEAMLRRITAERDGGVLAVTLMSSDMGKLYAALAGAVDRRR